MFKLLLLNHEPLPLTEKQLQDQQEGKEPNKAFGYELLPEEKLLNSRFIVEPGNHEGISFNIANLNEPISGENVILSGKVLSPEVAEIKAEITYVDEEERNYLIELQTKPSTELEPSIDGSNWKIQLKTRITVRGNRSFILTAYNSKGIKLESLQVDVNITN